MYAYNQVDQQLVDERVAQFRDQTSRFLSGELDEEVFKQLRLRNGLYVQRHAPMLRVAIPYGVLNSKQLRMLGHIAQTYRTVPARLGFPARDRRDRRALICSAR